MPPPEFRPVLVTVNSTGRQASSFVRVASALGWDVRAQYFDTASPAVEELRGLPNVKTYHGSLADVAFVDKIFNGAEIAFVNTLHWDDEILIGRVCADAAKKAGIKHYVYSSMPDHSKFGKGWKALPMWAQKFEIETYIRSIGIPATFVYTGIYNNNFTSLAYPLFRLELQPDHSFIWKAPFHPSDPLPWLDVEQDMGPALLQIFKEGSQKWAGHRIPLTFEVLTPIQACESLSRGLGMPVRYQHGPIEFLVPVPEGYKNQLLALQETLGDKRAPYFGPDMYYPSEAITLWEGNRNLEQYAREVFPEEERSNGVTWMDDDGSDDGTDGNISVNGSTANEELRHEAENSYGGSC